MSVVLMSAPRAAATFCGSGGFAAAARRRLSLAAVRLGSGDGKKRDRGGSPPPATKWTKKWDPKEERKKAKREPLSAAEAKNLLKRMTPEDRIVLRDVLLSKDPLPPATTEEPPSPAEEPEMAAPTPRQLRHLAFHEGMPFVGFGFLDNLIMILAGEYIDHTIGLTLGISTMAAAALGNTISDLFGIGSASFVERLCTRFFKGEKAPEPLTLEQLETRACRLSANAGRALGVTAGCLIGMFPLLFQ